MAGTDACLLDSNILLRISKRDDPEHAAITHALRVLVGQRTRLCYTSQTLGDFWNVSTRPLSKNGFGLTVTETDRLAQVIERGFEFLPDGQKLHELWRSLLVVHNIQGVQVHDARLAASMYVPRREAVAYHQCQGFPAFCRSPRYPSGRIVRDAMSRRQASPGSHNVFKDFGVPNAEGHLIKAQLVFKIDTIMKGRSLKQVETADLLGIRQPGVSKLLRGEFPQFSVERLLRFLVALDQDVQIVVKPHHDRKHAPAMQVV